MPGHPVIHSKELQQGELLYNRARALLLLNRADEATADLDDAVKVNAVHPHFPHFRAVACEQKGLLVDALHWYRVRCRVVRSFSTRFVFGFQCSDHHASIASENG